MATSAMSRGQPQKSKLQQWGVPDRGVIQKDPNWNMCSLDVPKHTKSRSDSAGSADSSASQESDNSVVQQQVKQVMVDLVTVLGELRTVVGDIKTLVTQIDVVTHKIDESVCSVEEAKRRASTSEAEKITQPKEMVYVKERPLSYHSSNVDKKLQKVLEKAKDYANLQISIPATEKRERYFRSTQQVDNRDYYTDTNYSPNPMDSFNHNDDLDISKNRSPKQSRHKVEENRRNRTRNDYVNYTILPPLECEKEKADSTKSTRKDMSPFDRSNKDSNGYSKSKDDSSAHKNKPMDSPTNSWTSTLTSNQSPDSEYSGLYEREMEDCLELEITESADILDQRNDTRSNSDSGQEESDDYVDWGKRQLDVARKQAEIMAWTRSSWTGQQIYHVSLDNSIGYSDDVTDGEPETELDCTTHQWNRFLPSTMNQRVVNYSWRTVIEP